MSRRARSALRPLAAVLTATAVAVGPVRAGEFAEPTTRAAPAVVAAGPRGVAPPAAASDRLTKTSVQNLAGPTESSRSERAAEAAEPFAPPPVLPDRSALEDAGQLSFAFAPGSSARSRREAVERLFTGARSRLSAFGSAVGERLNLKRGRPSASTSIALEPAAPRLPFEQAAARRALERLPSLGVRLDASSYRAPPSYGRVVWLADWIPPAALGLAAIAAIVGAGPVMILATSLGAWLLSPIKLDDELEPAQSQLPIAAREVLLRRVDETALALTSRLGWPWERAPRVGLSNILGVHNAWANPEDRSMGYGDRWSEASDEDLAAVVAHEMAHLEARDAELPFAGHEAAASVGTFAFLALGAAAGAKFVLAFLGEDAAPGPGWLFGHPDLLWSAAAVILSGLLVALGLALSSLGSQAQELRADHFGGWLSDPRWLAAYHWRKDAQRRAKGRRIGWLEILFSTHPSHRRRARALGQKPSATGPDGPG